MHDEQQPSPDAERLEKDVHVKEDGRKLYAYRFTRATQQRKEDTP